MAVSRTQVVKFIRKGTGLSSVTNWYAVSTSNSTAPASGWTTTVPTLTSTNKYLWNYEVLAFDNNTTTTTQPRVIGIYGDKGESGDDGRGISTITEYYLATSASSGVTRSTSGWTTTVQSITSTKKYLWNYEAITYTTGTTVYSTPAIIGVYGDKGDKGDKGDQGDTGDTGEKGPALRGPQAWSDCATGYAFKAGGNGESWIDVVMYNSNYYVCKKSHTKTSSNYPGSSASNTNGYWQLGDKIDLVATKILLATYALVENLGVKAIEMRDGSGNALFVAKDGNVTCNTGTFKNINISGTLNAVTGTFKSLDCVDNNGNTVCNMSFSSEGRMWFQNGDLYHQGTKNNRSLRFYASEIWCRGVFGARERSVMIVYSSYAYYYPNGLSKSGSYVSLTSSRSSANETYYTVPCYGQDGDYSGFPVDIVAFKNTYSSTYIYELSMADSQRVLVANCNNDRNNIQIYKNGSKVTINGGTAGEWVKLIEPQYPTTDTNVLGRGLMQCGSIDNDW